LFKKYGLGIFIAIVLVFSVSLFAKNSVEIIELSKSIQELEIKKQELEKEKKVLQGALKEKNGTEESLRVENELLKEENEYLRQDVEELLNEVEELTMIRVKLSAYSPYDDQSGIEGGPITATGLPCGKMYCAADPKKFPYGTQFYIKDYGIVEVQDTGSSLRKSNKLWLDLFFDSYAETVAFGIKEADVQLLKWGE